MFPSDKPHKNDCLRLKIRVKPMQDIGSYERMREAIVLLKILSQGKEQIDAADVIASLRARR